MKNNKPILNPLKIIGKNKAVKIEADELEQLWRILINWIDNHSDWSNICEKCDLIYQLADCEIDVKINDFESLYLYNQLTSDAIMRKYLGYELIPTLCSKGVNSESNLIRVISHILLFYHPYAIINNEMCEYIYIELETAINNTIVLYKRNSLDLLPISDKLEDILEIFRNAEKVVFSNNCKLDVDGYNSGLLSPPRKSINFNNPEFIATLIDFNKTLATGRLHVDGTLSDTWLEKVSWFIDHTPSYQGYTPNECTSSDVNKMLDLIGGVLTSCDVQTLIKVRDENPDICAISFLNMINDFYCFNHDEMVEDSII